MRLPSLLLALAIVTPAVPLTAEAQVRSNTKDSSPNGGIACNADGWCRVAVSGDNRDTVSVKLFNAQGVTRSAFVNDDAIPWIFDCSGNMGKRVRLPNRVSWNAMMPGTVGEVVYDYVCSVTP